jgi:hypothetical protein
MPNLRPELQTDPYPFNVAFLYRTADPGLDLDGWEQFFTSRDQLRSQLLDGRYVDDTWTVADLQALVEKLESRQPVSSENYLFFSFD